MLAHDHFIRRIIGDHFRFAINFFRTANVYRRKFSATGRKRHTPSLVVFMVDGFMIHGGLGDRLKGIVSTYALCKVKSLPFRICFDSPFVLQDYLAPNRYDWIPGADEGIVFSRKCARIVNVHNDPQAKALLGLRPSRSRQYHVYGNMDLLERIHGRWGIRFDWSDLFDELFKPSEALAEAIAANRQRIGGAYVSMHFRFQQLLGDFTDPDCAILPAAERERLVETCAACVEETQRQTGCRLLVISDSRRFLERMEGLANVHTLPGIVVHMDYVQTEENASVAHLKTFLDFFMLRCSEKVYTVAATGMHLSGFPLYAARSAGIPYEIIRLGSDGRAANGDEA
ncbi:MAG: hypothetical protein LBT76_01185 [Tannerella sp.]|jgi:hypothetical protein|nr:hypothetical protein [Tannerella sp.]